MQAYHDRVLELLTRLGNHVRIMFRVSCVPSVEENPASRLNDYFRDELTSDKDPDSCYYLYQKEGMVYGLYQDGSWQFGMKVKTTVNFSFLSSNSDRLLSQDISNHNGVQLGLKGKKELKVLHTSARFPL